MFAVKYKKKLDSIGNTFDDDNKSHVDIFEKYVLFSNVGVGTIGVNEFASSVSLWYLVRSLQNNK